MYFGKYKKSYVSCFACGVNWQTHEEKMTDVNIATELLTDAFQDRFDVAVMVSGDSDLSPPIQKVRELFPTKKIIMAFPPNRRTNQLCKIAHETMTIDRHVLDRCQLPDQVTTQTGFVVCRPAKWK